ncbi:E3 ubiquitin-protein ligase PRT1 isoform X1 [Typha latifolia]|uniref:E3 ubiquitin-protein ligase PRT1 isoform X1 n=1 Tax=Typha latifolia TaxID=4733 RepID=UPI003C3099AF
MAENNNAAPPLMDSSSSSAKSVPDGPVVDDLSESAFQCCVCLDLLYKPIVLACGHISCFWCVHHAMHGLRASHCPTCRQPYNHFPGICLLLHDLLLKLEPAAYKRREQEVLEEEKHRKIYSPQLVDDMITDRAHSDVEESDGKIEAGITASFQEVHLRKVAGMASGVSADDLLCSLCKELLYQPAVLNCGHVYCASCLSSFPGESLKCQVCQSLHPGKFPNVCLDLDHFLEERFPIEYASRREKVQLKKAQNNGGGALPTENQGNKFFHIEDGHLCLNEDLSDVHFGVGCDSCGMYPIMGKRYRCKDCKEKIGFDLCEACYSSSSKLPGRFNQHHTPDHKFELDDSQLFHKIMMLRVMPEEDQQQDEAYLALDDNVEDHVNLEIIPEDNGDEDEVR